MRVVGRAGQRGKGVAKSKVADQYVSLSVEGTEKAEAKVRTTCQRMADAAAKLGTSLKVVGAAGAAFLGYYGRAASAGTVEADQFARANEYLGRVIGQATAPYVRALTTGVYSAAQAYRQLSPATQSAVVQVALFAAGLGTAVVLLPTIVSTVGALVGALSLLAGPVGAAVLAVGGLGAAFLLAGDQSQTFGQRAASAAAGVAAGATRAKGMLDKLGAAVGYVWQNLGQSIQDFMTDGWEYSKVVLDNIIQLATKTAGNLKKLIENALTGQNLFEGFDYYEPKKFTGTTKTFQDLAKVMDNIDAKTEQSAVKAAALGKNLAGGASELWDAVSDLAKGLGQAKFQMKLDVQMESLQGTFDRLQKAFASGDGEDLQRTMARQQAEANQKLDRIRAALDRLGGTLSPVGP